MNFKTTKTRYNWLMLISCTQRKDGPHSSKIEFDVLEVFWGQQDIWLLWSSRVILFVHVIKVTPSNGSCAYFVLVANDRINTILICSPIMALIMIEWEHDAQSEIIWLTWNMYSSRDEQLFSHIEHKQQTHSHNTVTWTRDSNLWHFN